VKTFDQINPLTSAVAKGSGYGRFGGRAGIEALTELRWITVETEPGHFSI
jgi:acyl-CoA reductase-like NAD-dependent aldehyde dehydrogenase